MTTRQAQNFTTRRAEMEYLSPKDFQFGKWITLARGRFHGYPFVIVNNGGSYPTAYVGVDKNHPLWAEPKYEKYRSLGAHGGITYKEFIAPKSAIKDRWWIGWDYGHSGDYMAHLPESLTKGARKWTREEILTHVKDVIRQLEAL